MALCAQASPQSCRKEPTPSTPLAPKSSTVSCAAPWLPQLAGTVGNAGSPISWIGTDSAISPPSLTSASLTLPQLKPETKVTHSANGPPIVCCGSATEEFKTEDMILRPLDP